MNHTKSSSRWPPSNAQVERDLRTAVKAGRGSINRIVLALRDVNEVLRSSSGGAADLANELRRVRLQVEELAWGVLGDVDQ